MADTEALKSCPHCDKAAKLVRDENVFAGQEYTRFPNQSHGLRIECSYCCAMTCWWHTEVQAIAAWNRRPSPVESELKPVAWQQRQKNSFTGEWGDWYRSDEDAFLEQQESPNPRYEVRPLYTHPSPRPDLMADEIEALIARLNETARTAREISPYRPFNVVEAPRLFAALADEAAEASHCISMLWNLSRKQGDRVREVEAERDRLAGQLDTAMAGQRLKVEWLNEMKAQRLKDREAAESTISSLSGEVERLRDALGAARMRLAQIGGKDDHDPFHVAALDIVDAALAQKGDRPDAAE